MSTNTSSDNKIPQSRKIFSFVEHVKQLLSENRRKSQISDTDSPSCTSTSRKKKIINTNPAKAEENIKMASSSSASKDISNDFQTPLKGNTKPEDEALKLTKKATELQPGHEYTPETRNKYSQKNSQIQDNPSTARPLTFGKRKLEYPDSSAQSKVEKKSNEEFSSQIFKKHRVQVPASRVSYKVYRTPNGEYYIPVYFEKDLAYTKKIQETLKDLDMDNDCETETDVLETAIKTVLDDLEFALKAQREEDKKKKISVCSKNSEFEKSSEDTNSRYVSENSNISSGSSASNKTQAQKNALNGKNYNKKASSV